MRKPIRTLQKRREGDGHVCAGVAGYTAQGAGIFIMDDAEALMPVSSRLLTLDRSGIIAFAVQTPDGAR